MKFDLIETSGWQGAVRGMRNPLESWVRSDSYFKEVYENRPINEGTTTVGAKKIFTGKKYVIGAIDLDLMQRLIKGGPEHRKFLRYIHVQFDMTAPLYVWKEFDTYKIGTVANSTSTMHKLANMPITLDCFETDDYDEYLSLGEEEVQRFSIQERLIKWDVQNIINFCEQLRQLYLETKDKRYWKELIRWLPESWLQTRTIDLNYEVLRTIVHQRENHKLTEWHQFIDFVHTLPYADELIFLKINKNYDIINI